MSGNHHLIENFAANKETRDLGHELLNLANTTTAAGSGRAVGQSVVGIPAACMMIAAERLKGGDVTWKNAQAASCLKPKEFKRIYGVVKAAIEHAERDSCITYHELHKKYKADIIEEMFAPFITKAENELLTYGDQDEQTTIFRCVVFFWAFSAFKPKSLPSTEAFAASHSLPLKSFVELLSLLNTHAQHLKREIKAESKRKLLAPAEKLESPSKTEMSTRTSFGMSNETATPTLEASGNEAPNESPIRRSTRTNIVAVSIPMTPLRQSPRKQQFERSPTKIVQPPRLALPPGKKRALRELPSKDSPKKRLAEDVQTDDRMDVDETTAGTPAKKRKMGSPPQPVATSSRTPSVSPTKKKTPATFPSLPIPPPELAPTNRVEVVDTEPNPFLDAPTDSEDSDADEPASSRRFRPVYLEHKQWCARDPRLVRLLKKANKTTRTEDS